MSAEVLAAPEGWAGVLLSLRPATMIVAIHQRMSPALRARLSAEDLWQETLLHAWRDREKLDWQGLPAFRRWLLEIAQNRIRNAVDYFEAARRTEISAPELREEGNSVDALPEPIASTTPSRVAGIREEVEMMRMALEELPEDLREVVRLRLFEEEELATIAARMGIGLSAAKHRLRKGAELYQRRLRARLHGPNSV